MNKTHLPKEKLSLLFKVDSKTKETINLSTNHLVTNSHRKFNQAQSVNQIKFYKIKFNLKHQVILNKYKNRLKIMNKKI